MVTNRVLCAQNRIYLIAYGKNVGQYERPRVLGCEPVNGVLGVLSPNQLNIATFVHQVGDVCLPSGEEKW